MFESFVVLSIEHAYVLHDDWGRASSENGVPLNHYWRDYKLSLSEWAHSGWNDGDPFLDNYIGHPIQGAVTSNIQVQNDPQGEKLEFSNTKAYWRSRLKATLWNAVFSLQWEVGPVSEMTVEKYGVFKVWGEWKPDGTWPCHKHCVNGEGQVDLVMTPVGGLAWMLTEDLLDKQVVRRVEGATRNQSLVNATRCALNPTRTAANVLHGKLPWYRASRDAREVYAARETKKVLTSSSVTHGGSQFR